MSRLPLLSCCTLGLVVALAPLSAHAADAPQPAATSARASELFRQAQARFDARDFTAALPMFQEAWQLSKSPNARLYVARCLAELGRNVQAYAELSGVIADTTANSEPRYQRTREAAQAELAEANQRVSKLVITMMGQRGGVTVLLDDAPVPEAQLGVPIIVEPGSHSVRARAEGREDFSLVAELAAGQSQSVRVTFPGAAEPSEPSASAATGESPARRHGTWQTVGLVSVGVGAVALGVFATTGLMAKSKYDSVSEACGGGRCPDDSHADDIDSGRSLQTVANVSLVLGSVAVVAGGSLYFLGPRPDEPRVAALLLPGGGFASYRTRF